MTIVFNQDDDDFDDLMSLCDDNYYIMTFLLKKYGIPNKRPSYILKDIEDRNIPHLIDGVRKCLDLNYQILKEFKNKFIIISGYDDYDVYKLVYEKLEEIECMQKKHNEEISYFKKKIKELTKYIKKRSLLF